MTEKNVERRLVRRVEYLAGVCWKLFPIHISGLPDRLCLFPNGRVLFVELKAPGKEPSPRQILIHKKLDRLGFRVEVVDSLEGVDALVQEYE